MAAANGLENSKRFAAHLAVEENVSSKQTVGIGSGSTVVYAVEKIAELYHSKRVTDIICVPTGFQSENLIIEHKLPLGTLKQNWTIDVAIDGADEVDAELNCIKGGGGCHLKEKMVAFNAKRFIVIADYRKQSGKLCTKWKHGTFSRCLVANESDLYQSTIPHPHPYPLTLSVSLSLFAISLTIRSAIVVQCRRYRLFTKVDSTEIEGENQESGGSRGH